MVFGFVDNAENKTIRIILISAMSQDLIIGSGDGMPWSVPEEYQQYLDTTRGQTVIMGRRSFEIFGSDLSCDHVIVVTHQPALKIQVPGNVTVELAKDLESALRAARACQKKTVFVAGGASIYQQALPSADAMFLSTIHGEFTGDAWFPSFDPSQWKLVHHQEFQRYDYREWERN
ncbi:MAG: dihydrofolate reductase [Planctomycetales bacterium]